MENRALDDLRAAYKAAVEQWVVAIHEEEALATPDHSMVAVEAWEQADFREEDARNKAKQARREYQDALRRILYNF